MAVHEIETLVEYTIRFFVHTSEPRARDYAAALYDFQDRCDCGYTMLRLEEALTRIGYLVPVPYARLPASERNAASRLFADGFLDAPPKTFFDAKRRRAYVRAGSPLWKRIVGETGIAGAAARPVERADIMDVAESAVRGAAKRLPEKTALHALAVWHAYMPVVCAAPAERERALALQPYTSQPTIFECAERKFRFSPPITETEAFARKWYAPHYARLRAIAADPLLLKNALAEALAEQDFRKASTLAESVADPDERAFYHAAASLGFYQLYRREYDRHGVTSGIS